MRKHFLAIGLIGVVLLAGCASTPQNLSAVANSGMIQPIAGLTHDWGDIDIMGGYAEHSFTFSNGGSDDLVLKGATTSCMCTTAQIELPDTTLSPKFGMHSSGSNWAHAVKPGEKFTVHVAFDPMAHGPSATGPIKRTINLMTSADSPTQLTVSGTVLSADEYADKYANVQ